jgi:hypothetical protein
MDRVGKKLLATGNGRCNYSNINANVDNYYGKEPEFISYALREYSVNNTIDFFNRMGIFPREEESGKLYPYSGQAAAMLDALRNEIERHPNIEIVTKTHISSITTCKKGFKVTDKDGASLQARRVVIAGGGCASSSLGSDGSAFELLKSLGHKMTKTAPALVQLKTDSEGIKGMQGIKLNALVSLVQNDRVIASDCGEVLFTDYGVSGPPVFQLSAKAALKKELELRLDIMYEYNHKEVFDILEGRRAMLGHLSMESFFIGLVNKRLGNLIARRIGIEKLSYPINRLSDGQLWAMVSELKEYKLKVTGNNGFNNAQVTAGGIATADFDDRTMESRLVKGLYACGEVLDIYGDCGGYNLQWAWSSGRLAGASCVIDLGGN